MNGNNDKADKKLRQLENQSLPDLSKQDQHWQQMQAMMQGAGPGITAKPRNQYAWWLAAACVTGILLFIGYKLYNKDKKQTEHISTINPKTIIADTLRKDNSVIAPQTEKGGSTRVDPVNNANLIPQKNKRVLPIKLNARTTDGKDTVLIARPVNDEPAIGKQSPKALLNDFFKQLEKTGQEFVINPAKDTLLKGHNGTALLIGANTFNTSLAVTIVLREFYSYQDIITHKLNTSSDGKQLVSGGMLHLAAMAGGKEVAINPGRSIRWFIPDTSVAMQQMSLFTGNMDGRPADPIGRLSLVAKNDTLYLRDSISAVATPGVMNWIPNERFFRNNYIVTMVKVLDLRDLPYKKVDTKKGLIGKFHIAKNAAIDNEQLAYILKEKYNYYKVKLNLSQDVFRRRWAVPDGEPAKELNEFIGDSTWLSLAEAQRYNLTATDTMTYTTTDLSLSEGLPVKKQFAAINMNELANRFSVDIRTLGWINCDRFLNDNRPKLSYEVMLDDTASNYNTVLVFEQFKSMLNGRVSGNRVIFDNIPQGEPAKIISIGIKDGQAITAMQALPISNNTPVHLQFEATDPPAFKEQVAILDK